MKQLRILFNMRGIPIVFVLVANPHPIGLAIKHQFGLNSLQDEYEAGRILEKFVDTFFDLSEPISLSQHMRGLWERVCPGRLLTSSFMLALDERTPIPDGAFNDDVQLYGAALDRMSTSNSLYANLRTLEKTLTLSRSQRDLR